MARFPALHSKRDGPAEHEWLFGDRKLLPDDETEAAYYWEFGLETPDVVAEIKTMRRKTALSKKVDRAAVRKWHSKNPFPGAVDTERLTEWDKRFNAQFPDYMVTTTFRNYDVHFLSSWPEFPSQHWLQIPERAIKSRDKKRLPPPRPGPFVLGEGLKGEESTGEFDTVPADFFKTGYGLGCYEKIYEPLRVVSSVINSFVQYVPTTKTPGGVATGDGWTEYRLFKFSWARSDRKLKADFTKWLKENRPDDRQPYHRSKDSDSRRTTERDLLKALGAFRLLRHFKGDWKAAADYSEPFCRDKRGNPKPLYVEQSEWRDAEKRAREALTEFHSKVFTRKVFG